MKYLIFFFTVLCCTGAKAQVYTRPAGAMQNVDTMMHALIDGLRNNKTDAFVLVSENIVGGRPDSLGFPSYRYLFWQQDTTTYFQQMKGYAGYGVIKSKAVSVPQPGIFSFIKNNYDTLWYDVILPFTYKYSTNGIDYYKVLPSVHGVFYKIDFFSLDDSISMEFELNDLNEGYTDSYINLNYKHNAHCKQKKLWDMLRAVIDSNK